MDGNHQQSAKSKNAGSRSATRSIGPQIERQLTQRAQLFGDPLLPLRDVAVALGNISYSTIRALIKDGELPTVRIGRRGHHKVRLSVVQALLARCDRP